MKHQVMHNKLAASAKELREGFFAPWRVEPIVLLDLDPGQCTPLGAQAVAGPRWSLIVIRAIMFGNRRHYRELLNQSLEGIASNVLADRLKTLVAAGLLTRRDDPTHRQKAIYSLTEPAIQLVPLLVQMGAWGCRHTPASKELSIRAQILEERGPRMWKAFMAELRRLHLGAAATGP
jgi:DNA-binding HxlR family transcriptional regulator